MHTCEGSKTQASNEAGGLTTPATSQNASAAVGELSSVLTPADSFGNYNSQGAVRLSLSAPRPKTTTGLCREPRPRGGVGPDISGGRRVLPPFRSSPPSSPRACRLWASVCLHAAPPPQAPPPQPQSAQGKRPGRAPGDGPGPLRPRPVTAGGLSRCHRSQLPLRAAAVMKPPEGDASGRGRGRGRAPLTPGAPSSGPNEGAGGELPVLEPKRYLAILPDPAEEALGTGPRPWVQVRGEDAALTQFVWKQCTLRAKRLRGSESQRPGSRFHL
ncbi:translation initiation factor IF-2-like [Trichosurus vulpecula]|uniref:translation initiation factor IF-2-like n=1 Tax=Trichosurus vulpecula TaxID=9337 RepID=UPI00186B1CD1|nr:translation initiation factor IF-2-like [Trichosurus vulpecula]XP_036594175.1 translation initiation factor IF-2-like [Trichosurus vulpecula]